MARAIKRITAMKSGGGKKGEASKGAGEGGGRGSS
jgi:hypothetical protein